MSYKYRFEEFLYDDGDSDLVIIMDNKKYQIISQFLMSDVQKSNYDYFLNGLDKVLEGKSNYEELNGNVCGLEVDNYSTKIYDNLAEDGMGNWCEIETIELKNLILVWINALENFKENKEKNEKQIELEG